MPITPIGTTLKVDPDAGGTTPDKTVGHVTSITPGADSVAIFEAANVTDTVSTKIAGRTTPGQLSFSCYYHVSADADVFDLSDLNDLVRADRCWLMTLSNGSTLQGNAILSQVTPPDTTDSIVSFQITLEKTEVWVLDEDGP